jgi:hypothetical protein
MLFDMPGQRIINLGMAGNRLFLTGGGIEVDVVTGTMTQQPAALVICPIGSSRFIK